MQCITKVRISINTDKTMSAIEQSSITVTNYHGGTE